MPKVARIGASLMALASIVLTTPSRADDPPDSEINEISGNIEIVDAVSAPTGYRIRHIINDGDGEPPAVFVLTSGSHDDESPRIEVDSTGNTWVTWWRDGPHDEVLVRKKTFLTGTWSDEQVISAASEESRNPEIVDDGVHVWVAYEIAQPTGTVIAVGVINDEPDPFGSHIASTPNMGTVDVMIHHESQRLWVTWIDDGTHVGWCKRNSSSGAWGTVNLESYASDDVTTARQRIKALVLAN